MKRILVILLALVMVFAMAACGGEKVQEGSGLTDKIINTGDVSEIIKAIAPENIGMFGGSAYDAEALCAALNEASSHEMTLDEMDEAEKEGAHFMNEPEEMYDYPWHNSFEVTLDGELEACTIDLFACEGPAVVGIMVTPGEKQHVWYFESEALYDIVRGADEADWVIDEAAFEKYGQKAEESAKVCFESEKDELGLTDTKLVHFEKIWEDKDSDGADLLLYSWEYSVGVKDPSNTMLAAGMRFDYEMRLRTFNGYWGELAVKEKDGEAINTALIVNDEMVWPEEGMDEEQAQFVKDRVIEKLG